MVENLEREQLKAKVIQILNSKEFGTQEKKNLLQMMLFIYDHYKPPLYIKISKTEYLNKYLKILEKMKQYKIVNLEELNEQNSIAQIFRGEIRDSKEQIGNLELVNGRYVRSDHGSYYCSLSGLAEKSAGAIFTLDKDNLLETLSTCHHEMTHLGEGKSPFSLNSAFPMSYEFRKMCVEGRAIIHQGYLDLEGPFYKEQVEDQYSTFEVVFKHGYALYGNLYRMMQILFGDEILEELSENNDSELDMIEILSEKFPNLPVEQFFAHIFYILSCFDKKKTEDFALSLYYYQDFQKSKREQLDNQYVDYEELILEKNEKLEVTKELKQKLVHILNDPKSLNEEYQREYFLMKTNLEKDCLEGIISKEEYEEEMRSFTLENYQTFLEIDLENGNQSLQRLNQTISSLQIEFQKVVKRKTYLENSHLLSFFKEVCFDNPSLENSFVFIGKTCMNNIKEKIIKEGQSEELIHQIAEIIEFFSQLKCGKIEDKKTNLI